MKRTDLHAVRAADKAIDKGLANELEGLTIAWDKGEFANVERRIKTIRHLLDNIEKCLTKD